MTAALQESENAALYNLIICYYDRRRNAAVDFLLLLCSFVGKSFFFAESRDLKSSFYMFLKRKLIPTRRCCLQMKAATEGKMGSAQLSCRRNGSEMRLFPRKAVILIPSCAVPESVFLVTFVTTDKSNPQRSGRIKTTFTIYLQRNSVQVKIYTVAAEVFGRLMRAARTNKNKNSS